MKELLKKVKSDNGITMADLTISIIIITIFTGVVGTLMLKSYKMAQDIKIASYINASATAFLEKIDEVSFDEAEQAGTIFNKMWENDEITKVFGTGHYDESQGIWIRDDGKSAWSISVSTDQNYLINGEPIFKEINLIINYRDEQINIKKLKVREL